MANRKLFRRKIQGTEGARGPAYLEGLMELARSTSIPGARNNYSSYQSQVLESYRKYNGEADFGNQQFRAVIDIRTSFIAGEGLSVAASKPATRKWLAEFIEENRMFSSRFFDLVLGTELTGKALVFLKRNIGEMPRAIRVPWTTEESWNVILADKWDPESISGLMMKTKDGVFPLQIPNFVFFRLGGDDISVNKTTTRSGIVLNDFENYDRALKDLRLNNHVAARITPNLETESDKETDQAIRTFKNTKWKIGKMRIGTGKFSYVTPNTGAADNLKDEMATTLKTISSATGIPVHWIGWADLMNNRATADSLYETINNATSRERAILADGFKDLFIKAQEVYINSGGTAISAVDTDIKVSIPVVDRSKFLELVRGLSLAYGDEAISMEDYRSALPGIDPMETGRQREAEDKIAAKVLEKTEIPPTDIGEEENEDGNE